MSKEDALKKLREPFPERLISKLPKPTKAQNDCPAAEKINCKVCGGWHHPKVVHLDYVGHAALTDRLLDTDPLWYWEPMALKDGLPAFDESGGLWIRLYVAGHSRIGYGHAMASSFKEVGSREKEVIGDALRNAAMRFGAALELWHKGELHEEEPKKQAINPVKEALEGVKIAPERAEALRSLAQSMREAPTTAEAYAISASVADQDEKLFLWAELKPDSALRKALKDHGDTLRRMEKER